jgi:hypothetical protein
MLLEFILGNPSFDNLWKSTYSCTKQILLKHFKKMGVLSFGNHVLQIDGCKHWWDYETSWKFQLEFPINETTWKIEM